MLSKEAFTRQHLTINELINTETHNEITKILVKVDRPFAHYLFWEKQSFGFKTEDVIEHDVFMQFDCPVHPTFFVRWFMKFADSGEITEPLYLKEELQAILNAALKRS